MKICAIICEYNPFHNGHLYQIREAKRLSGADGILCLMSGNFVQRGGNALLDKYTRARHAILAGADVVVELPPVFATSNAEIFAKGAISILSKIPAVQTLCFGTERADKELFLSSAKLLNDEPKSVSEKIKNLISSGMSYAKARALAYEEFIPTDFLSFPNNILGLEYTKAILGQNSSIEILPLQRVGAGYHDKTLGEIYSSATAIRNAIRENTPIEKEVPDFVKQDLPNSETDGLEQLEKYALLSKSAEEIKAVLDCTEGLENAFKKIAQTNDSLVQTLTTARYTSSRIRRIALQNLLNITKPFILDCLQSPLFLSVLAIKKENNGILSALGESNLPLLTRAHDEDCLTGTAKKCWENIKFADQIYYLLAPNAKKQKNIFI